MLFPLCAVLFEGSFQVSFVDYSFVLNFVVVGLYLLGHSVLDGPNKFVGCRGGYLSTPILNEDVLVEVALCIIEVQEVPNLVVHLSTLLLEHSLLSLDNLDHTIEIFLVLLGGLSVVESFADELFGDFVEDGLGTAGLVLGALEAGGDGAGEGVVLAGFCGADGGDWVVARAEEGFDGVAIGGE